MRKALNKAEREGLTCRQAADADTIRRWFYPLYVSSMTRLGSPPHSLDYFLACQDAMPENLRIFWAVRGDTPVAGLLGFSCGKRVSIINIVSDKAFWELRPNDLVHWEFIKWAGTSGFDYFDFGSVRYDGQMQFKKKWGCVMEESGYFYIAADADRVAEKAFDSSAGAMSLASSLWARFMPEGAAVHLGPLLRRHLIR